MCQDLKGTMHRFFSELFRTGFMEFQLGNLFTFGLGHTVWGVELFFGGLYLGS